LIAWGRVALPVFQAITDKRRVDSIVTMSCRHEITQQSIELSSVVAEAAIFSDCANADLDGFAFYALSRDSLL